MRRGRNATGFLKLLGHWPVVRQLRDGDPHVLGKSVQSQRSLTLRPRLERADHVVQSICPYCAVGCGQLVWGSPDRPRCG